MNAIRVFPLAWLAAALWIGGTAAANEREQALVLGDSVAFAYIDSAGFEYINPDNFVGFANRLDNMVLDAVDAGCPGETTGSFLSAAAPDNGCRAFRSRFPLHVDYKSTQMDFARKFLREHRHVRLVTITLGANDGFLLEAACASQPASPPAPPKPAVEVDGYYRGTATRFQADSRACPAECADARRANG